MNCKHLQPPAKSQRIKREGGVHVLTLETKSDVQAVFRAVHSDQDLALAEDNNE